MSSERRSETTLERELRQLDRMAVLLDARFRVPGTSFRIGWDGIVGMVPVLGDTATVLPSLYLIWRARRLGLSAGVLFRMAFNSIVDYLLGSIPVFGDIFDAIFKANLRNTRLLRRALQRQKTLPPTLLK